METIAVYRGSFDIVGLTKFNISPENWSVVQIRENVATVFGHLIIDTMTNR